MEGERDTASYLMGRKGDAETLGDADDPFQDALIALTKATGLSEIFGIISNGLEVSLSNVTDVVVYILDPWTNLLTSCDGLAGASHTLPYSGLAGKLRETRSRSQSRGLDEEDPLWGLLASGRGILPHNRTVVCSPIIEFGSDRLLCSLLVVCDVLSTDNEKKLNLFERHISACLSRMQRTNSCPSGKDDLEDMTKYNDNILELCADLHDNDAISLQLKVIKYLERQTQAEFCTLFVVSEDSSELFCQVIGGRVLKEEVKFIIPLTYFNTVVVEKKVLTHQDIGEEEKKTLAEKLDVTLHNFICVPVINNATSKVVAVACAINKLKGNSFGQVDIKVIRHCFRYTVPVLTSTLALQTERELKQDTQCMLQVAKNLFTHLDDVSDLLREIMQEARNLTHAERCSLFLVENDELVAKVFDGHVSADAGEVRIPITQGIAGHVATTGKILNITDVYSHPLFYRGVDDSTGFRTRSILCFPIRDGSKVVGIAELCNKVNGLHFTKHDEDVAAAFSIYCGISIVHGLLYKKMTDAQYRSALANELMMYHMKILEDELKPFEKQAIPKPTHFHPQVAELSYSPRGIPDSDTVLAVLSMFDDMGFINRWRIDKPTLARFTMLVKRGYRDPPYHNWYHALSVGHFCYLLYKNFDELHYLEEIEVFALFVACICHDLDHRGTNNSFQVHSKSVLAALYSSEGSVMERHHFAQAMCILNTEGCNIFENLSRKDYQQVLDLMQDIILATDLAHHLRIITDLKKMAKDGYNKSDPNHHQLLLCLLMTSCDLSDQTKNWPTTKKIAELIYREFFTQGDLEKAMGLETPEMFDREKAFIPELQINFLEHIAQPVFQILCDVFPKANPLVEAIEANKGMWTRLRRESLERRLSSTNSLDFFHVRFSSEPSQEKLTEESETDSNQNFNG
ncbi:cGMP-dependent 3',5'-cyclic phosphodiesterase [Holothuria leucospilota]|uniref:Phosphodiesterase n=1 Tax=Holothuria leucospilota TaxID=206669 RepID=A0A9Q1BLP5_HOLLE|nr:cGMP-dependent 3',5'-cyclic phosphodiesterase [Holothuria leucospilota]